MVIITTKDTHRLATYSEKELGIGSVAFDLFPIDIFCEVETQEERRRLEKQLAWLVGPWDSLRQSICSPPTPHTFPWHNAHLGFSSSSIHSQSDRKSTANDVDFKEGAKEVAAAQGNHLLWGQGQDWVLGVQGVGPQGTSPTSLAMQVDLGPRM